MRFKVPSNPNDSGIPHPCVSGEHRENHPSQCSCKGRRRGREEDRRLFQPQEQQPEQGPSFQPQDSPKLCAQHQIQTHQSIPTASPGVCRPLTPAHNGWASPLTWQRSDVAAPDVSPAVCPLPNAPGKARARAGSPDLLTVRASPWQSRNTQEPTPPSHLAGLSSGTPIRSWPSLTLAQLQCQPAWFNCCSLQLNTAQLLPESKLLESLGSRSKTRKASADALRCFPALAARWQDWKSRRTSAELGKCLEVGICQILQLARGAGGGEESRAESGSWVLKQR